LTLDSGVTRPPPLLSEADLLSCMDKFRRVPPGMGICIGPPVDRYADRPLLGGTIDWGCFHLVTTRN
ncbi:hypothetical protein B296_00009475, partial [Ensete ventricosum]